MQFFLLILSHNMRIKEGGDFINELKISIVAERWKNI
jgi:hypothetical protein